MFTYLEVSNHFESVKKLTSTRILYLKKCRKENLKSVIFLRICPKTLDFYSFFNYPFTCYRTISFHDNVRHSFMFHIHNVGFLCLGRQLDGSISRSCSNALILYHCCFYQLISGDPMRLPHSAPCFQCVTKQWGGVNVSRNIIAIIHC